VTALIDRLRHGFRPTTPPVQDAQRPLYARVLRLRHLSPGKVLCAVYFEGSIVLAMLLAFADLVSWYGVLAFPVTVAAMVKFNDLVAGRLPHPPTARRPARSRAADESAPLEDEPPVRVATFDDLLAGHEAPAQAPGAAGPEARRRAADPGAAGVDPEDEDTAIVAVIPVRPSPFLEAKTARLQTLPEREDPPA
jgi:hypothetical protein